MFDWLWNLMWKFGWVQKEATIVLVGLDNAGKSTLLYVLRHGSLRILAPTTRTHYEELELMNINFRAYDVGGHDIVRELWTQYTFEADAIVFVVDSACANRMEEAKEELHLLLGEDNIAPNIPFLILGNKTDLNVSLSQSELKEALGLNEITTSRRVKLFRCSLVNGTGYKEAFQWLGEIL
eukprot:TRINITY_DN9388_c0_g1_i1.p1 TRINITY_DN9388_c0_g1~~TRINITY_DN9388_c0_g1_i1.p1  ORF type:complete len:181 (+),score=36.79 TRINITY_DN9388_c0_g1_i1:47-589(+)